MPRLGSTSVDDMEYHPFLDFGFLSSHQMTIVAMRVRISHRVGDRGVNRLVREGQLNDLLVGDRRLVPHMFSCVDDDVVLLVVHSLVG